MSKKIYEFESGDEVKFSELFKDTYKNELENNNDTIKLVEKYMDSSFVIQKIWDGNDEFNWYVLKIEGEDEWFKENELVSYVSFELGEELFLV